jgi:hypothetical protein
MQTTRLHLLHIAYVVRESEWALKANGLSHVIMH